MEFILYRLIQLTKRELNITNEIYANLILFNERSQPEQALEQLSHKKRLAKKVVEINRDKKEEYQALAKILNLGHHEWTTKTFVSRFYQKMDKSNYLLNMLFQNLYLTNQRVERRNSNIKNLMNSAFMFQEEEISVITEIDQIASSCITQYHQQALQNEVTVVKNVNG